jgi:hypothetical protein
MTPAISQGARRFAAAVLIIEPLLFFAAFGLLASDLSKPAGRRRRGRIVALLERVSSDSRNQHSAGCQPLSEYARAILARVCHSAIEMTLHVLLPVKWLPSLHSRPTILPRSLQGRSAA